MGVELEEPRERARKTQRAPGVVRVRPGERRAQVVVLALEALQPGRGVLDALVVGAVGVRGVVSQMAARDALVLAARDDFSAAYCRSGSSKR